MSTAPNTNPATSARPLAELVKRIGELHLELAQKLEALPAESLPSPSSPSAPPASPPSRSLLVELVRSVLAELGLLPSTDPTHPDEDPMPILFRDFGFAHLRFAMKGDEIVVESASGFEMRASSASRIDPAHCGDDSPSSEPITLAPNTKLVRLRLSADHQIDPSEVVAMAVPADLSSAFGYDMHAISADDRTIYVTVRNTSPNVNAPLTLARVNVLLFRVK
ncbi:MAG: hypothetical protein IT378_05250 [Sandaracinaceae bacterium]|nr:hypothetical protein [Sandaracinaceae bacterium]